MIILVTRHPAVSEWVREQEIEVDREQKHLSEGDVFGRGDTVVGNLPVHLAARVCGTGAIYMHVSVDVPPELRGRELTVAELKKCGIRLEAFEVRPAVAL